MKKTRIFILLALAVTAYAMPGCKPKMPNRERTVLREVANTQTKAFNRLIDTGRESPDLLQKDRIQSFKYSAEVFSKEDMEALLSESGCSGIRIYHALDKTGRSILLMVGVQKNGDQYKDLLPKANAGKTQAQAGNDDNYILNADDPNLRCKENCDITGVAN